MPTGELAECDLARAPSDRRTSRPATDRTASRRTLQLGERRRDRERRAVRTDRGHRVERVRDAEHARLERDRVALEAMRIAGAVPALVVMEHGRHRDQEVVDALDQPRARDRMAPDLAELLVRQRAGLAEHRRFDRDLADVVQRATQPERLEPLYPSSREQRREPPRTRSPGPSGREGMDPGPRARPRRWRAVTPHCSVSRADARSLPACVELRLREGRSPERDRSRRAPGSAHPRLGRAARGRRLRDRGRAGRGRARRLPGRRVRGGGRGGRRPQRALCGSRGGRPGRQADRGRGRGARAGNGADRLPLSAQRSGGNRATRCARRRRRSRWSRSRGSRARSRWTRSRRRRTSPATRRR